MRFYSNCYRVPVPEILTAPVAYHVVVLRHSFRGPHGQAQSHRVGHVVGPDVRGRRDVAARSTFVISFPLPRRPSRGS
ncbi:hypothetical protein B296_00006244 [Ensete ventricosum]|uniref:Uncharacterized protein n=1 Tax=Ensete ventricosum TaxID=4639 RepID=A0A426ZGT8_ENSVE|nr:hypothetical protein B296_00006244 [Ensete ventricosum]